MFLTAFVHPGPTQKDTQHIHRVAINTEGHTADTQGGYQTGEGPGNVKMFREEMH